MEGGCQEIINSLRRFGLGQDGTPARCPSMNGVSCSVKGKPSPEKYDKLAVTQVRVEKEKERPSQWIEIGDLPVSMKRELSPRNPVLEDLNNVMALTRNHNPLIQEQSPSSLDYLYDLYRSGNLMINGYGDFSPAMGSQFSDGHTIGDTVMGDQFFKGNYMTSEYGIFRPEIKNDGYLIENITNPTYFPYKVHQESSLPVEHYFVMRAKTRSGSEELQRLLGLGNHTGIQIILDGILGSLFALMTDDNGHRVFGILVEKCNHDQLQLIVNRAKSQPDRFLDVALTDKGSKSIWKLIKRIKRIPPMAMTITKILRLRCFELLTHKTASYIIRQCFVIFGEETSLLFLESIAPHLLDLATDRVGCISLNNFIGCIGGEVRVVVLDYLANHSLFLSNDPSGNFVVQYLLDLNNRKVTETIIRCLTGSFEQLAQKQGGSHVTEKCIRYSELGLKTVVSEITKNGKALLRLARDQFGNYVVQTALKQTKMMSDKKLYTQLLDALKPYYPHFLGKTRGRHVVELIKDDLALHKAKSDQ